ncbi:MAG: DUF4288 domain-containing protein [Sporanaerobacter sp.]|jgi:hypothetical protein|uniref:hypothetical protein n=1 Tax=Sporanaerobacter sp. TaxID=2010183 RepID=UPI003A102042
MKGKGVTIKYKVYLVAYKNLDENVVDILTKYSVYHVDNEDDLKVLNEHVSSGRTFSLNERIYIYLESFEEKIREKLKEDYVLDIIEVPKSYGAARGNMLIEFDIEFGDDIIVVDTMEI